jgi:hypothetical protein
MRLSRLVPPVPLRNRVSPAVVSGLCEIAQQTSPFCRSLIAMAAHSTVGFTASIVATILASSSPTFRSVIVAEADIGAALAGWDLSLPRVQRGAAIEAQAFGYRETTVFPATQAGSVVDDIRGFLRSDEEWDEARASKRLELLRHLLDAESWPSFTLVEAGIPFTAFAGVESRPRGAPQAWPASRDEALRAGFITRLNAGSTLPYHPTTGLIFNTAIFSVVSFAFPNCVISISRRLQQWIRSRCGRCPECGYTQRWRAARCSECGESCQALWTDTL